MKENMKDYKILPSVLSADFGKLLEEAATVDLPEIDFLHIDVMDGHFVPNLTIGPKVVKSLKQHTRFKLDVHLMVDNAPDLIPHFAEAGADNITIHQEAVTHLDRQIHRIKELGATAGISLNPATSLDTIRWLLAEIDLVLIMSVNPGFGGQEYIPYSTQKIEQLAKMCQHLPTKPIIEVDGGINPQTAPLAYQAGARYFVSGSAIFGHKDRPKAIQDISKAIDLTIMKNTSRLV
jgi:ribulose-phosphate 3-epimerase